MANLRSIQSGLFLYDCEDYHAILGLPVDAPQETIRSRYLKVTRQLHPDRRRLSRPEDGPLADELLAKLVNPAYESLYKNKAQRSEQKLVLEATASRMVAEGSLPPLKSEAALQLSKAGRNFEQLYRSSLQSLSKSMYKDIENAATTIGEISELNLVYLFRKGTTGAPAIPKPAPATPQQQPPVRQKVAPASGNNNAPAAPQSAPQVVATSNVAAEKDKLAAMVEPYLRRARGHLQEQNYTQAVLELRDALALDNKNADCHGLLGYAYFRQNQLGMARVHTRKALQLNPQEKTALVTQRELDKRAAPDGKGKGKQSGFLGGLFGRGQKK